MSKINADKVATDYYGHKASVYDKNNIGTEKWNNEQETVEKWLCLLPTGCTILDIPCGTGRFFQLYEKYEMLCTGADISDEMLSQAANKITNKRLIQTTKQSIFDLKKSNVRWDASICIRLLNFFKEDELVEALGYLCNVTRKTLIFSMRTGNQKLSSNRCNVHNHAIVRNLLNRIGFIITDREVVGKDNYCLYKAIRI